MPNKTKGVMIKTICLDEDIPLTLLHLSIAGGWLKPPNVPNEPRVYGVGNESLGTSRNDRNSHGIKQGSEAGILPRFSSLWSRFSTASRSAPSRLCLLVAAAGLPPLASTHSKIG